MRVKHELEPFYDKNSEILILGSIPSPKSREEGFYYAHPQNRFWKILALVFDEEEPITIEDKKLFLSKHHIALWDTIKSCDIDGASDSSIRNLIPNDINKIISKSKIRKVFTTGKTSYNIYNKYIFDKTGIAASYLPSSSPANCKVKMDTLVENYRKILD